VAAVSLKAGDAVTGPAMIEGYTSTIWAPPRWCVERDAAGNIIMQRT
jgi:N-methylhydantoinase A